MLLVFPLFFKLLVTVGGLDLFSLLAILYIWGVILRIKLLMLIVTATYNRSESILLYLSESV